MASTSSKVERIYQHRGLPFVKGLVFFWGRRRLFSFIGTTAATFITVPSFSICHGGAGRCLFYRQLGKEAFTFLPGLGAEEKLRVCLA